MVYSNPFEYTSSGCTFAGAPTPTTATCSYSQTLHIRSYSTSRTTTYNVPDSTVYRDIYSATLAIAGSAFPTSTATKTGTGASVTQASTRAASSNTDATDAATTTATGNLAYKSSAPIILMGVSLLVLLLNLWPQGLYYTSDFLIRVLENE